MAVALKLTKELHLTGENYTEFASDLGFLPGFWPEELIYKDERYFWEACRKRDGDVLAMDYKNDRGIRITVFND